MSNDIITPLPEPPQAPHNNTSTNAYNEQRENQQQEAEQNLEAQPANLNTTQSHTTDDSLKRPRVPHKVAISHIAWRFLGLCISIASIVIFVVLYTKYNKKLWLCLAAAAYCIPLDILDIIPILNASRKIHRLRFSILALLEFPGIGLALASIVLYLWDVWHISDGAPAVLEQVDMWMQAQWFGALFIGIWRVVMAITMCRCSLLEDRRKKARAAAAAGAQAQGKKKGKGKGKGKQTVYA